MNTTQEDLLSLRAELDSEADSAGEVYVSVSGARLANLLDDADELARLEANVAKMRKDIERFSYAIAKEHEWCGVWRDRYNRLRDGLEAIWTTMVNQCDGGPCLEAAYRILALLGEK